MRNERVGEGRGGRKERERREGLETAPCFISLVRVERGEERGFKRGLGLWGRRRGRRRSGRGGGGGFDGLRLAKRENGRLEEGIENGN